MKHLEEAITTGSMWSNRQQTEGIFLPEALIPVLVGTRRASKGSSDLWIVKIDEDGNKLWDVGYGGSSAESLRSLEPTSDGEYIIGSSSNSGVSGDKTDPPFGGDDYWILKIDQNDNKLWDASFGGIQDDDLGNVIPCADGGFLLAGTIIKSPSKSSWNVVKADAYGSKLWDKIFGFDENNHLFDAIITDDGGFILGGHTSEELTVTDYTLVKINASGIDQWETQFGEI